MKNPLFFVNLRRFGSHIRRVELESWNEIDVWQGLISRRRKFNAADRSAFEYHCWRRCGYPSFPCGHYCRWWWWCCYCQRSFRCWLRGWIGAAVTTTPSLVGATAAGAGAGGAVTAIRCWLRGWIGNRFLFINNKIDDDGQFLRKILSRVADVWQSPTSRPRLGEVLQPSHVRWCEGRRDREKQGGPGRQSDRQCIGGPSGKWRFTLPSPSLHPSESSFSYLQSVTSSSSTSTSSTQNPPALIHSLPKRPKASSSYGLNTLSRARGGFQTVDVTRECGAVVRGVGWGRIYCCKR
ncbi:hypothetical protein GG344DRAFT_84344 [Lentinula edodes]|nr:hypothetical protein GG344DRAFT_84344 [Lentinula edodes]